MVSLRHYEEFTVPTTKGALQLKITLSLLNRVSVASLLGALISLLIASLNGAVWAKSIGSAGMFTFGAMGYVCSREGEKLVPATQAKEALDNQLIDEIAAHEFVLRTKGLIQYQSPALPQYSGDLPMDESGWSAPGDIELKLYDWENLPDENTGIMIAGGQGYGKTSVCVWLLGKLTETKPAIIEVLDPHGGINEIWRQNGLTTLSEYGEIESRLHGAISELDSRRQRAKNGDTNWDPYIFVCDEIDSCLENFGNSDVVGKAIRRLGKEGRKYDLSLIFITHTANASAKGIDAQERNCYVNILLGGSARNYAKYNYKKTDFEPTFLSSQAYPCIVVSGGEPFAAIHPTHGGYSQYKKKGNAPANLLPINQIQQGSVKVHEPAELSPAEPLNPLSSKEFGGFEPVNLQEQGWDMGGNLPPKYLGSMVQAIRSNLTKKDILEGMFLAKKGGDKYYQSLSNIYEGLRGKV